MYGCIRECDFVSMADMVSYGDCTVYSAQCTVLIVQCTVYSAHCTVYGVQCSLYSVRCTSFIDTVNQIVHIYCNFLQQVCSAALSE